MKIQDIFNEMGRGWNTSLEKGDDLEVTVDGYKIKFNLFQHSSESPQQGGWDEAPYSDSYLGEVVKVLIDSIVFVPANFDIPDLGLELDYPFTNPSVRGLITAIQNAGSDFNSRDDREKFDKYFGNPLHNDPKLAVRMLTAIQKEAQNATTGRL